MNNKSKQFSLFRNKFDNQPVNITIQQLAADLRSKWKQEIEAIRGLRKEGKNTEADKIKADLPCITLCGVFEGGHQATQIREYNHAVSLDFDYAGDKLQAAVQLCRQHPAVMLCFITCSGNGLRVVVNVDTPQEQHVNTYKQVGRFFAQLIGLKFDKCHDLSRISFISYDEQTYFNPEATVFDLSTLPPASPAQEKAEHFMERFLQSGKFTNGERNSSVFDLGMRAKAEGINLGALTEIACNTLVTSDFTAEEATSALHNGYARGKQFTDTADITDTMSVNQREKLERDQKKMEGEELRANTPTLPEEIFPLLPPILRELTSFPTMKREKDLLLLSAIAALSACLPEVTGRYRQKEYTPHLYFFAVANAGSGKGIMTRARQITEKYQEDIEAESDRMEEEYIQQLANWEHETSQRKKHGEAPDMKSKPKEYVPRFLMIPGISSKSSLILHLAHNGKLGGLIFETEANSLALSAQQKCGLFDDVLCGCFEHEDVSNNYLTNGKKPQRARKPRLAIVLSGTPSQFTTLISSSENGLFSRFLLDTYSSPAVWDDVSPAASDILLQESLNSIGCKVAQGAKFLRECPTTVQLTRKQWNELNKTFGTLLSEADCEGQQDFLSVVKRYCLMAFRICMVLAALRKAGNEWTFTDLAATDDEFHTSIAIVKCCLEHSRLLLTTLPGTLAEATPPTVPKKIDQLVAILPDTPFTYSQAKKIGAGIGICERQVCRYLSTNVGKRFKKDENGRYEKLSPAA